MQNLKSLCKLISQTNSALQKHYEIWRRLRTQFITQEPISQPSKFQRSVRKPKVAWTNLFKDLPLPNLPLFVSQAHLLLAKPCTTLRIGFLSIPRPTTTHLKKRPPPLAPFRPWCASEEAMPTLQYLARPGQEPPLLRIHLKLRLFRPLRVGCPLALLSTDTRHGDHRLLHPLSHQYAAFHPREPGPQALERRLGIHSLSLRPQPILSVLPTLPRKPSSRGLWLPSRPLRAIQIVEPGHFIPSFNSTLRPCNSSRSFEIHLDCSKCIISSALWLLGSFSTLEWRWTSISPWLLRAPRVPPPFISALTDARVS